MYISLSIVELIPVTVATSLTGWRASGVANADYWRGEYSYICVHRC